MTTNDWADVRKLNRGTAICAAISQGSDVRLHHSASRAFGRYRIMRRPNKGLQSRSKTLKLKISSINSQDAAHALEKASMQPTDEALFRSLCMHSQRRIDTRNAEYEKLIPDLLAVAQDSSSHWRYVLASTVSKVKEKSFYAAHFDTPSAAFPSLPHQTRSTLKR